MLGHRVRPDTGVLVAVPIPEDDELDPDGPRRRGERGPGRGRRRRGDRTGGHAVRPCPASPAATEGRSVPANLALAEHNAGVAAEIAVAVASAPEGRLSTRSGAGEPGREGLRSTPHTPLPLPGDAAR